MRQHRFIAGSALLLTLLSVSGDAQAPPGMRVLSPDRLRDGKVISAEDNFSIVVPPGEWQWWERNEEAKSVSSFTALERDSGTAVSVTVTRRVFREVSREFAEGVVQGMKNSVTAAGGSIAVHAVESSERPLAGATRIVSTITLPGREPLESQTLVFKRGYTYAIQVMYPRGSPRHRRRDRGEFQEPRRAEDRAGRLFEDPPVSGIGLLRGDADQPAHQLRDEASGAQWRGTLGVSCCSFLQRPPRYWH